MNDFGIRVWPDSHWTRLRVLLRKLVGEWALVCSYMKSTSSASMK